VRYSFNGGSVPPEADTFSVDYFNVTAALANPAYGQTLAEEFKDLMLGQTRLNLANSDGDLHYEGQITRYDIQPVAVTGDEVSSRNRLTVELKVRFFNKIEPEKDKELTLRQFEDFESNLEFSAVESDLVESINTKILQDLFDQTLGDW
jgi:hypothetical protein